MLAWLKLGADQPRLIFGRQQGHEGKGVVEVRRGRTHQGPADLCVRLGIEGHQYLIKLAVGSKCFVQGVPVLDRASVPVPMSRLRI